MGFVRSKRQIISCCMRQFLLCLGLMVFLSLLDLSCAYTTRVSLDPRYQTVAISGFYNKSSEYDFQAPLTNALIRKFINDGRLKVVKPEERIY